MKRLATLTALLALGLAVSLNSTAVTGTAPPALELQNRDRDIQTVTIGAGTQNARLPLDFYYCNSLYETLYLSHELGFTAGTITSLALYNQFSFPVLNSPIKIWLGSTGQHNLSNGWIPASELTLVFEGNVDFPDGNNTILITLRTPYLYTGGNLVMMVNRPMDSSAYSLNNFFKCQTSGTNRARNIYDDYVSYDPYNPPAGSLTGQFPKITFYYTPDLLQNDLGALTIVGNSSPTVGTESTFTVRIRNNGTAIQDSYTVKLVDENDVELASATGPAIPAQQILELSLPWTPATSGNYAIYGKVELNGDQVTTNNLTPPFDLIVNPEGVVALTVGDGNLIGHIPVDFSWNHSLYQTIYRQDEMCGFIGEITGIRFYNKFKNSVSDVPVSIWLGTTSQPHLLDAFIPSTQLTLVHSGPVHFPDGEGITTIVFDEPYLYLGDNNLVMMVNKIDTDAQSLINKFKCQLAPTFPSRMEVSDDDDLDPAAPPVGMRTGLFPKTTFVLIPSMLGCISGTVTDANNQPLSRVAVSLNNGINYTITNTSGQYQLSNVIAGTYTLSFNLYGYYGHTQTVTIQTDDDLTIDVTLQPMSRVSVTGTILASDTGVGIPGARIRLSGYEPYSATTNIAGNFTIAAVFADHTYAYNICAPGYSTLNSQITLGFTDHDMGIITLSEAAYAPSGVAAAENDGGDAVDITWLAPDPDTQEFAQSFEGATFPPPGWIQITTNNGPANAYDLYPTWCRAANLSIAGNEITPTDGNYQAGIFWSNSHQDEWLISPGFICPPNAWLTFDSHVFLGSDHGDHYYLKLSTDNGNTWTPLWDASEQTGGWNEYAAPISADLSSYSGNALKIAFHAVGGLENSGLRYYWFIDNLHIGSSTTAMSSGWEEKSTRPTETSSHLEKDTHSRVHTGYLVYRLPTGQEQNQASWHPLSAAPVTALSLVDTGWLTVPNGGYRWAVKAIYTSGVTSVASFSNIIYKDVPMGMIVGTVRSVDSTPIAAATVTSGTFTATTNSAGVYALSVPVGCHSVTASAAGFGDQTVEDVLVEQDLTATVNFVLNTASIDDPRIPVTATALSGNYPNPFNPQTTISYSVKEPGMVRIQIYNIKGQLVRTLVDEAHATGHYKQTFDARDDRGRNISNGVYLIRMQAPGYHKTSKMILMK